MTTEDTEHTDYRVPVKPIVVLSARMRWDPWQIGALEGAGYVVIVAPSRSLEVFSAPAPIFTEQVLPNVWWRRVLLRLAGVRVNPCPSVAKGDNS